VLVAGVLMTIYAIIQPVGHVARQTRMRIDALGTDAVRLSE
jgi:hypothetical protein